MRKIQNKRVMFSEKAVLITRADAEGNMIHASKDFLHISGYQEQLIVGKQFDLFRHPDMPKSIIEDQRITIEAGNSWSGTVKNLSYDGFEIWVDETILPIYKDGTRIGSVSVRSIASDEQITKAEALFKEIKRNKSTLVNGEQTEIMSLASKIMVNLTPKQWVRSVKYHGKSYA